MPIENISALKNTNNNKNNSSIKDELFVKEPTKKISDIAPDSREIPNGKSSDVAPNSREMPVGKPNEVAPCS